jgi:hypothetical protein
MSVPTYRRNESKIELAQYRTVEEAEKDGRIIEAVQNIPRSDI